MDGNLSKRALLSVAGSGLALLALITPAARGQLFHRTEPACPPPPCPPIQVQPATPAPSPEPAPTTPTTPPPQGQQLPAPTPAAPTTPEPSFGVGQAAATGGESVALSAPNMLGDLLGAGRSLSFFYQRTKGSVFINGTGSTSISNPKVAENNSPLPEDRVYFRYNFFSNSQSVVGDTGEQIFDPSLGLGVNSAPRFRGVTATKQYNTNLFTFGGEKTFFDGRASVEVRIPFSNSLASNLNLSVAQITGRGVDNDRDSGNSILQTVPTPGNTFGSSDTEWGNMTVILKALAYKSNTLAVSGGVSIGIPTAQDTKVRVTDFLGDFQDNDVEILRSREFRISNDTWSLSPFIAVLATPTNRLYAQGFLQVDVPVNRSNVNYSELPLINTEPSELSFDPLVVNTDLGEQTLLQADLGVGYWIIKDRPQSWLQGLAPTLELHYTTTLDNANIVALPLSNKGQALAVVGPNGQPITEPVPTVGNRRGRVDILDITVGTTFLLGDRVTLATGFSFPLRTGDNRTFDYEYQVQLNYYFGTGRNADRFAPPGL